MVVRGEGSYLVRIETEVRQQLRRKIEGQRMWLWWWLRRVKGS